MFHDSCSIISLVFDLHVVWGYCSSQYTSDLLNPVGKLTNMSSLFSTSTAYAALNEKL